MLSEKLNLKKKERTSRAPSLDPESILKYAKCGNFFKIPHKLQTKELAIIAFSRSYLSTQNWNALREDLKTQELLTTIIVETPGGLPFLSKCNVEITKDMVDLYIKHFPTGFHLYSIPHKFQTKELILKADKSGWPNSTFNEKDINPSLLDEDIILHYVNIRLDNIYHIPKKFITEYYKFRAFEGLCLSNCLKHGVLTESEIFNFRDKMKLTPQLIDNIPRTYQTKELIERIISRYDDKVGFVSISSINRDIFPIELWPSEWFLKIRNAEICRKFIQIHGAKIISDLPDIQVICENKEYCLVEYKYPSFINNVRSKNKALIYNCPSSGNLYFTQVDPKINTITKALKFLNNDISKEELAYES